MNNFLNQKNINIDNRLFNLYIIYKKVEICQYIFIIEDITDKRKIYWNINNEIKIFFKLFI